MTDRYAVLGNPIAHSKSPQIHRAFAEQTGQDITYEAILAPINPFESLVRELIAKDYKGANITVPFKVDAYEMSAHLSERAKFAGAVNTLVFDERGIFGDNTDGLGLVRDIEANVGYTLSNAHVLLLGAGGAAQGVAEVLFNAEIASMTIWNRTHQKAQLLADKFADKRVQATRTLNASYDVVINATSASLTGETLNIQERQFKKGALAYEMMYGRETPFMAQARSAGAQVVDGLGMLVEQAAEAFYLWRGIRPETQAVIQALRNN